MKLTINSKDPEALNLLEEIARRLGMRVTKGNSSQEKKLTALEREAKEWENQLPEMPEEQNEYPVPDTQKALLALEKLKGYGTFRAINDPVQWQRELRKDRPLEDRDE